MREKHPARVRYLIILMLYYTKIWRRLVKLRNAKIFVVTIMVSGITVGFL